MKSKGHPSRSNRGRRPPPNPQEDVLDEEFYKRIFGEEAMKAHEEEEERNKIELARKTTLASNLLRFPYSRAYHYFYDLSCFPRLSGSHSYAVDAYNAFEATYRQEDAQVGSTTAGQLFNRIYFGLPLMEQEKRRQDQSKNNCHGYLFENESKKYNLDRLLYTCQTVLKHIDKLMEKNSLNLFSILKMDQELVEIYSRHVSVEDKKRLLERKIKMLQERKELNCQLWETEDNTYFYHSLNQKLHNEVKTWKRLCSVDGVAVQLQLKAAIHQETLQKQHESKEEEATEIISNQLIFHGTESTLALSPASFDKFVNLYSKMYLSQEQKMLFPLQIIDFSGEEMLQLADEVIAMKLNAHSEFTYYSGKILWKKVFGRDLSLKKEERVPQDEVYLRHARRKVEQLKRFVREDKTEKTKKVHYLDRHMNWKQFGSIVQPRLLISCNAVEITNKELFIVMLYHWVCIGLTDVFNFSNQDRSLPAILASDLYVKVYNLFVEAVGTPSFGMLYYALENLCDCISRSSLPNFLDNGYTLQFQWMDRIGVIWKLPKEEWETEKNQSELQLQEADSSPKKRVKVQ